MDMGENVKELRHFFQVLMLCPQESPKKIMVNSAL